MTTLRDLVDRYTDAWNERDEAVFRSMVLDGCVRHDPGRTVTISAEENVARFVAAREQLPGYRFSNDRMWEHGDDTITLCYQVDYDGGQLAGIEVFRFAHGRIVEVWNAPAGQGGW